jgi:hypothetical protein
MNQENKSTTPSETSWDSVSFFSVLFPTEPEPGFAHQEKKNKTIKSEAYRSAARILHATSYKSRMNQESKSTTPSKT